MKVFPEDSSEDSSGDPPEASALSFSTGAVYVKSGTLVSSWGGGVSSREIPAGCAETDTSSRGSVAFSTGTAVSSTGSGAFSTGAAASSADSGAFSIEAAISSAGSGAFSTGIAASSTCTGTFSTGVCRSSIAAVSSEGAFLMIDPLVEPDSVFAAARKRRIADRWRRASLRPSL